MILIKYFGLINQWSNGKLHNKNKSNQQEVFDWNQKLLDQVWFKEAYQPPTQ